MDMAWPVAGGLDLPQSRSITPGLHLRRLDDVKVALAPSPSDTAGCALDVGEAA
jgi:hypothetical protein